MPQELKQNLLYLKQHSSISEWYNAFGTDAQMILCDPQLALGAISSLSNDECPSLGLFKCCYQEDAMNWMRRQIDVLNVSASVQNKLSAQQITILAADIFTQYYYWNLADVCVFFGKIRRGQYGIFYNNIDNIAIMNWAREFNKERTHELDKFETALAEEKKERAKATTPTLSRDAYLDSLSDEQKEQSSLYALKTGKRKLFEHAPKVEQPLNTGITKPTNLDCPPPLSEETIRRREEMIRKLEIPTV